MIRKIELVVDDIDYATIQEAIAARQLFRVMPDVDSAGCNLVGRTVAEICRGWIELHRERPDRGGDEWKQ